jgi:hypothetical protein
MAYEDYGGSDGGATGSQGMSAQSTQKRPPKRPGPFVGQAEAVTGAPAAILNAAYAQPATQYDNPYPATDAPKVDPPMFGQNPPAQDVVATSSVQPPSFRSTGDVLNLPDNTPSPSTDAVLDATSGAAQESKAGMPTLANQHPFLRKLGSLFGLTGPEPEAGALYTGPSTPAQKQSALQSFIARVTGGLAMGAAHTPQEQEIVQRQIQFPQELELQRRQQALELQRLQNERDWREGMLGEKVRHETATEGIGQQNADTRLAKLQNDQYQFSQGMIPIDATAARVLFNNPAMAGRNVPFKVYEAMLKRNDFEHVETPDGTYYVNKRNPQEGYKLSDGSVKMAMANAMAGRAALQGWTPVNDAQGNTVGWTQPGSGNFRSASSVPGITQNVGDVIPPKPTGTMRNIAGQAQIAANGIPDVIREIDALGDSLGPVAGRWNEFIQGKVGTDNPAFAGLRADLLMVSSAVALAHARGRLPENLREEFDQMINAPQQDPENIKAVLSHILPWMQNVASTMAGSIPSTPRRGGPGGPVGDAANKSGGAKKKLNW